MKKHIFDEIITEFEMMCPWAAKETREYIFDPNDETLLQIVMKDGSRLLYDSVIKSFRYFEDAESMCHSLSPSTQERWTLEFSHNLYRAMRKSGYSQGELSEATGISQASISNYVNGTSVPSIFNLVLMARAMRLSKNELAQLLCYI